LVVLSLFWGIDDTTSVADGKVGKSL